MIPRLGKFLFPWRLCNATQLVPRAFSSSSMESEIPKLVFEARKSDMPVEMENPYVKPRPQCVLCKYNINVNYKNTRLLSQFVSPFSGRLYGREVSGLCERQQNIVKKAITVARRSGLMPYCFKEVKYIRDPSLFNPDKPFRPHRF